MIDFDASQRAVLGLDEHRHARVLGAPGSGKTRVLVEVAARALERGDSRAADTLVLAPNRLVASDLRRQIEQRCDSVIVGSPVRTAASFAFATLTHRAALLGREAPRLLSGAAHDEAVSQTIAAAIEAAGASSSLGATELSPEVLRSAPFRAELREFSRVLDDFDIEPAALLERLPDLTASFTGHAETRAPAPEIVELWRVALRLLDTTNAQIARSRPGELSSSALLRAGRAAIRDERVAVPMLVLVDDAHELGEGQLALLAALAQRGAAIWAFGDPDIATTAYQGERARLLAGVGAELTRREREDGVGGGAALPSADAEQVVVLTEVHRHGPEIREFIGELTRRIGAAGTGAQRAARAGGALHSGEVEFATAASESEQLGAVAHRLRRRKLGLDGRDATGWGGMAVVCRNRTQVVRVSRALAAHQVPTSVAAGGMVLREHQLVRELIRLLQHSLGIARLDASEILELLGGVVGGLDAVAMRRLRDEVGLFERAAAKLFDRRTAPVDQVIATAFAAPGEAPLIDSRGGRRLRRLGLLAAQASTVHERGGTPREVLWALWDGARLAEPLQDEALSGRGVRAIDAHRTLDAVMGLFFSLQRHEEQLREQPVAQLLEELLSSGVPEDSLASLSERDVVTVTTPQGLIGREFDTVCVLGPQEGEWPNLRGRGQLLGVVPLERWLKGDAAAPASRVETMHDELRLFAQTCSRAQGSLLVIAVADEQSFPSAFHAMGRRHAVSAPLPSSRLTLRGSVAAMRRRLTADPTDEQAITSLIALAREGVPGAHPDEWYGVRPATTDEPLVDLSDPEATVGVSPSRIEAAERCPLDWAVSALGGGTPHLASDLGSLLHLALESAGPDASIDDMMRTVDEGWSELSFEAEWQQTQQYSMARRMAEGLISYLRDFAREGAALAGSEAHFELQLGQATLRGTADRLELRPTGDGEMALSVVDLKTSRRVPTKAEQATHPQLQAYQLGVVSGAFETASDASDRVVNGGARLLFVHPSRSSSAATPYALVEQPPLSPEQQNVFRERVAQIAEVMAAGRFQARVEHHCENPNAPGNSCAIHIIPAVSHA